MPSAWERGGPVYGRPAMWTVWIGHSGDSSTRAARLGVGDSDAPDLGRPGHGDSEIFGRHTRTGASFGIPAVGDESAVHAPHIGERHRKRLLSLRLQWP